MASENSGKTFLIVPYEWILENVEKDFKTITSNLILFRGERVFRLALKNLGNGKSTLLFVAINLNKLGLKISGVVCGKEGSETHYMMEEYLPDKNKVKCKLCNSDEGSLQLFTRNVDAVTDGKCTFLFQIHLEGIVTGYSYKLCDRLAKDQLWSAVNSKLHADVEFFVQDKRFSAHKAILAARSPVFRAEFAQEEPKNANPYLIRIGDVDASSFEQFLHFVYTGEPMTSSVLANKDLLKLAEHYQLETLEDLCRAALLEVNAEQLVNFVANLVRIDGQETNFKIWSDISLFVRKQINAFTFLQYFRPEKDTEVYADDRVSTFECCWTFKREEARAMNPIAEYQSEKQFFAQLDGGNVYHNWFGSPIPYWISQIESPQIRFFFVKPRNCGFKIVEVAMAHRSSDGWIRMKPDQQDKAVQLFTTKMDQNVNYKGDSIIFRVKIVNTIENNHFHMVDTNWGVDLLWEDQWTDVDILVGSKKLEAHRVVLSARSPVFKILLSKISYTGKATLTISADVDFSIVENFVNYLYTGNLEISANNKELLSLAEMYQVETLTKICQLAVRESNVEDLTTSLFTLI